MLGRTVCLTVAVVLGCGAPVPSESEGEKHDVETAETPSEDEETTVRKQFSRRLSPQARKAVLMAGEGETVRALVQVAASADVDALIERLRSEGTEVGSWMEETRLLTVEIAPDRLQALAELPGVVYVEVATPYRD